MIKKRKKIKKKQTLKRQVITLEVFPGLFSLLNAFFGFLSIMETMRGKFKTAAILIIVAWLMDILDGFVARSLQANSLLGIQLDSLSDLISFGLAPSLLIYSIYLRNVPQGWIIPFIYSSSGIIRLARYNVIALKEQVRQTYFTGLPIPASAIFLSGIVLLIKNDFSGPLFYGLISILLLILSFLMVSKIKYPNSKYFELMRRKNLAFALMLSFIIAIAYVAPHFVVLFIIIPYILFPLIVSLNNLFRRKFVRKEIKEVYPEKSD